MGLFHRKEQPQIEIPYTVSIGSEQIKLIVGLGNPGSKYNGTRHNIGFACVDSFVTAENSTWNEKKALKCHLAELRIGQSRVVLIKPTTYMNLSGEAVRAVQSYFKIANAQTIVVHDELDIAFGQIRTRIGGSSAGNNGVESIISHLGKDFGRIRVGIKNDYSEKTDSANFVLRKFSKTEQESMKTLFTEVNALLNEFIFGDTLPAETRKFL